MYKGKYIPIMNMKNLFLICMLSPFFLFAQKKGKEKYVFEANAGLMVDEFVSDWGSKLYNMNSDIWTFGIAVENGNLFAKAIVKDQQLISEAIRNGILLNISYSDKKKDGARLLFPRVNFEKLESQLTEDREDVKFSNLELLESTKGYYVAGFSKLPNGLISFSNEYGLQAKCTIDSLGNLIYEAKVPLKLINFTKETIAVELGVNTQYSQFKKATAGQSNSNSRGYYMLGRGATSNASMKNPYGEETAVWFTGIIR